MANKNQTLLPSRPIFPTYSTQPQGPGTPQGPSMLDKVGSILNTPAGAAGIQAAGAGIAAYGANKSAQASREQNAHQFAAEMAQRQHEAEQQDQRARLTAVLDAAPLGEEQSFAQKQALLHSILGATRNYSVTPGDPAVAAAMGSTNQGGMRLPEGGFDPAMLNRLFGDEATQASIAARQKDIGQLNPRAAQMDFSTMFGKSADGSPNAFQTDVQQSNAAELQRQLDESAKQRAIIQRAIDEDIRGEKQAQQKHGNIFGKMLKLAGTGLSFVPGAGQIAAPILTGVGGLVNGDGVKSSIINAGMSAVPGLAGAGKFGKSAQTFAKSGMGKAIMGGL